MQRRRHHATPLTPYNAADTTQHRKRMAATLCCKRVMAQCCVKVTLRDNGAAAVVGGMAGSGGVAMIGYLYL
jgi:hypothetical protein